MCTRRPSAGGSSGCSLIAQTTAPPTAGRGIEQAGGRRSAGQRPARSGNQSACFAAKFANYFVLRADSSQRQCRIRTRSANFSNPGSIQTRTSSTPSSNTHCPRTNSSRHSRISPSAWLPADYCALASPRRSVPDPAARTCRRRWFPRWHPAWAGIPALAALILVILFIRNGRKKVHPSVLSQRPTPVNRRRLPPRKLSAGTPPRDGAARPTRQGAAGCPASRRNATSPSETRDRARACRRPWVASWEESGPNPRQSQAQSTYFGVHRQASADR